MAEDSSQAGDGDPWLTPMKPRAILWDLFGDHLRHIGDRHVPMRALTVLLGVFGVAETTGRVVLSRMRREGWFSTFRDGRQTAYAPARPGPEALRRQVELAASYRALPFRDPDLPSVLLPEGWQGRRAHALFTAAHDALHGPADAYVRDVIRAAMKHAALDTGRSSE
jgi:DNA-binding transcriptional regulator PaaX